VRPTCDGAGRTFVQDGFDARTGDEREPREQPGGRKREVSCGSERVFRKEIARRPRQVEKARTRAAKRRKLKLELLGFEIRISAVMYAIVNC